MFEQEWKRLLMEPTSLVGEEDYATWFDRLAERLLCGCRLLAGGIVHRLIEIEFYYWGGDHRDPFAHGDPFQLGTGHWYFHRSHGVLRGGSFKGIDLTFGGAKTFAGILIRSIEPEQGPLVEGPSRTVDYLLGLTQLSTVAALHQASANLAVWEGSNPVQLLWQPQRESRTLLRTARVGLTLKKREQVQQRRRYLLRPYRYLTEPRRLRKGKLHLVMALHLCGTSPEDIRTLSGCNRSALKRYLVEYEHGLGETCLDPYVGMELRPRELARLYGLEQGRMLRQKKE